MSRPHILPEPESERGTTKDMGKVAVSSVQDVFMGSLTNGHCMHSKGEYMVGKG